MIILLDENVPQILANNLSINSSNQDTRLHIVLIDSLITISQFMFRNKNFKISAINAQLLIIV